MSAVEKSRRAAIRLALRFAKEIQEESPDLVERIIEKVRDPTITRERIALAELAPQISEGTMSLEVALTTISYLCRGNEEYGSPEEQFEGKLSPKERAELAEKRRSETGKRVYASGKGVNSLTPEERSNLSREVFAQGKGLGSITGKERRQAGRQGGIAAAKSLGYRNWYENDPLEPGSRSRKLIELSQDPEYSYMRGERRDVNAIKVADAMSKAFPNDSPYTPRDVTVQLSYLKRGHTSKPEHVRRKSKQYSKPEPNQWRSQIARNNHRKRESHFLDQNGRPTPELECILASSGQDVNKILKHVENEYHHGHKAAHIQYAMKRLGQKYA